MSFYRNKAMHVRAACRDARGTASEAAFRITASKELLLLPGVGRKTANLVLILAFNSRKNICVDTHVHRISNRLGWVATKTPEETEHARTSRRRNGGGPTINLYLVTWGQNVCRPVYPRCGACHQRRVPARRW